MLESEGAVSELCWDVVESAASSEETLAILPRATLEHWMLRLPVLHCSSWGELREAVTPEVYAEVCGLADYGDVADPDAEVPDDHEPFSAYDLSTVADGDWPPAVGILMTDDLPRAILTKYASFTETIFNGTRSEIAPGMTDDVLTDLRALGFTLAEDHRLADLYNALF